MSFFRLLMIVSLLCVPSLSADTIYVDASATGENDGSSWTDAYTDIQSALGTAVSGYEIWVAAGTYKPTTDTNRSISFLMKDGVSLYGGFPNSGDPNMIDRDTAMYETILSGDIGVLDDSSDNSYHVLIGANNATLDGFFVTKGHADGGGLDDSGGGIYIYPHSPVIKNCVFIDNHADSFGGAVFAYSINVPDIPTIENCRFIGNDATSGGVAFHSCDSPAVKNSVFSGNSSDSFGGGIYCYLSDTTVMNCSFSGNSADFGGAFYSEQCTPVVSNSVMWGNSALSGSQISSSADVTYCAVEGGWGDAVDNNIDCDPIFLDADGIDNIPGTIDDDLHIDPYSLCINMGDPNGDYVGMLDNDGEKRIRYQRIDIGAYEVFPIMGDLDANERVELDDLALFTTDRWLIDADLTDFAIFGIQWQYGAGLIPIEGDLNGDEKVDMDDLLLLIAGDMWLIETDLYDFSLIAGNWQYGVD